MNRIPPAGIECHREGYILHSYDIFLGQDVMGSVNIEREGLYYHFRCSCQLPSASIYYVILQNGNKEFNLGVCIPDGNTFRAYKRIAMKQFDNEDFKFNLVPKQKTSKTLVAVDPAKPFEHLQDLENARLDLSNDTTQIVIEGSICAIQDQQDSDQSRGLQSQ